MRLLVAISIMTLIGCGSNINEEEFYIKEKFILVSNNTSEGMSNGKFSHPIYVKQWLIRSISKPIMYRELSSYGEYFTISNKMWYKYKPGDTLYFEYLRKDKFFKID